MFPKIDRRRLLGVGALTATVPGFLAETGRLLAGDEKSPSLATNKDRVLVVIQLAGGNDGLNTLVPFRDDAYYKARPKLAIARDKALKLTDEFALHPEAKELRALHDDGRLGVITNVGYPNPNRSHFRATEIWETATPEKDVLTGWVGRYFDAECKGVASPMLGLQLGEKPAMTFAHPKGRAVTLTNPDLFKWEGGTTGAALDRLNRVRPTGNDQLDFLQRTANDTLTLSKKIQDALADTKTATEYAPFNFSQSLKVVAQMIAAEVPTRVYYVSLGGFDTHVTQANRHAGLLQELSQGLGSFVKDLKALGHLDRTLVITFSEFGRRVAENEQQGTDHGTAGVMFLASGGVKAGVHGGPPDLNDLDEGDLKFKTDFRRVYAAVLANWFKADAQTVLGGAFKPLPCVG
jgi:uncharacterized protein (DUF1501 family)